MRDSPALSVAGALNLAGATVTVFDPEAMENAKRVFPTLSYADTVEQALEEAELVILATEWKQFQELDPVATKNLVVGVTPKDDPQGAPQPVMIDGRNCLPREAWEAAGWRMLALGRG